MNLKQMEIEMIKISSSIGLANEIVDIVIKKHPKIFAQAIHNFLEKYPDLVKRVEELAREKDKNAKIQ